MKKLFFLMLLTASCSIMTPSETIKNPKCENFSKIEVFQVLGDGNGMLAHVCNKLYCDEESDKMLVYYPAKKGEVYYDGLTFNIDEDKCPVFGDSYTYATKAETIRTVPVIKEVEKRIANPKYKKWQEEHSAEKTK